ncbi:MAG: toprim domain-containing protein [Pirellulales bacterium]
MARVSREQFGARARLDDCRRAGADAGAELFVVEGESAAASVVRVRDARFQAVLPMQGKPLNALRASRDKVLAHPLFGPLIAAIGTGLEPEYRGDSLRYGRILLLMDPDADGIHCGALLLMFFHHWMPRLIESGRVELVRPPWGEVTAAGRVHRGLSDDELTALADRFRNQGPVTVRRYRGLAAIDADVIRDTCVSPATRHAKRVLPADVAAMIEFLDGLGPFP